MTRQVPNVHPRPTEAPARVLPPIPPGRIDRYGMIRVYNENGEARDCWPVDARELVATGEYSFTPPTPKGAA